MFDGSLDAWHPASRPLSYLLRYAIFIQYHASQGDMSVATLLRILEASGREMTFARRAGHSRTLEDILAEQRQAGRTER